ESTKRAAEDYGKAAKDAAVGVTELATKSLSAAQRDVALGLAANAKAAREAQSDVARALSPLGWWSQIDDAPPAAQSVLADYKAGAVALADTLDKLNKIAADNPLWGADATQDDGIIGYLERLAAVRDEYNALMTSRARLAAMARTPLHLDPVHDNGGAGAGTPPATPTPPATTGESWGSGKGKTDAWAEWVRDTKAATAAAVAMAAAVDQGAAAQGRAAVMAEAEAVALRLGT
ncbi:hypothetical protein, partial [Pararhodospirillum oryzae]|uniref:hypothetical protein n=1 Tax=Pararhodospirillum oryzae TaxID=478448 RepID=UPI001C3FCFFB